MIATIFIDKLLLEARHGVLDQERRVGNSFTVSISIQYPIDDAAINDDINSTVNYAEVVDIIRHEMAVPANLLEHVAWRIARAVTSRWPAITGGFITVSKPAPPIPSASLSNVSVTIPLKPVC